MQRQTILDPFRLVGSSLGQYHLLELVGIGGMGAVYKAQHARLEDEVALKILKPDLVLESRRLGANLQALFLEEARNTSRLKHPNIVSVRDCAIEADRTFLVMEWLEGQTLEELLEKEKVLPPDRLSYFLGQICDGMSYAHRMGIIHRDLKPSNIMIVKDHRSEEVVKILDFGIGKALTSTFHINTRIIGAPYYASPEQLKVGAKIDRRADVYSLGVMTYHLLTGSLPFNSDSIGALVNQHLQEPPPSLSEIRPEISPAIEEVVLKALAKRPENRYQSVDELARAFRKAVSLETGLVRLRCIDATTGWPLREAAILFDGIRAGETDENGIWTRPNVMPRSHTIEVECAGYMHWESRFNAVAREETELDVRLEAKNSGDLIVQTAKGKSRAPITGLPIRLNGGPAGVTDSNGVLHLKDLPPGKCSVEIDHRSLKLTSELEITRGKLSRLEVALPKPRSHWGWFLLVFACLVTVGAVLLTQEILRRRQAAVLAATTEVKPEPTPAPAANEWLKELGDRRTRVTGSELANLIAEIKAAEAKYSLDYRFTYEHAKLEILGTGPSYNESFKLLLVAAEKAINNGDMNRMANALRQDQKEVFRPLFEGQYQWPVLQLALGSGDKTILTRAASDPSRLLEDLNGQWEEVLLDEDATLTIQKWDGETFSAEHVQGDLRVAISGKVNAKTREITFTDKNTFRELGMQKGTISDDWKSMSWEGSDGGETWALEYHKKSPSSPKPKPAATDQSP